jgi:release factor glutamine methyltransferase
MMPVKINNLQEEILLCDITGRKRIDLYASGLSLDADQKKRFDEALKKRRDGLPVQYITGKTEFYGLPIMVGPGVFIPRPETEILVEAAIKKSGALATGAPEHQSTSLKILDLCTGSGCIAIVLAKHINCAKIIATDISGEALEIARQNALLNNVAEKIDFRQADLFSGIDERFDIITCNPPYIKRDDIKNLPQEVSYEPQIALDAGQDGLDFYRMVARQASGFLKPDGILALELGDGQAETVRDMFGSNVNTIKDLNGIERVLIWTR